MRAIDCLFLLAVMFIMLGAFSLVQPMVTGIAWSIAVIILVYKVFVYHIAPSNKE